MGCDKCKSKNIKELTLFYQGNIRYYNVICGDCGHIKRDYNIWG